jgi:dihydrodipicolinate synthase/N-acetylneuraminate lyase
MVKQKKYRGIVVPIVTPFTEHGDIDLNAVERIVEHITVNGVCPFALGTTGEAASINYSEKAKFVETVVKTNAHRTFIFAGISDNCLATSVELAKQFFALGVDIVVAHVPSYYPLTSDDILGYFEILAEKVPGSLMLYNIPATTGMSIPLEVVDRLSHIPTVIGLKDSVNDIDRAKKAIALWKDRNDFSYLIGCTSLGKTALAMGADGVVPSVGNIVPDLFIKLYNSVLNGRLDQAEQYQKRADDISDVFQKNRNLSQALPVLKAMMHILGFCSPKVLPPMRDLTAEQIQALRETMNEMRLLQE